MGHLGEGTQITTIQDKEIVLTATNGQHFRMKVADLAEAVRQVMPIVTSENKGLMSKDGFIHRGLSDDIDLSILSGIYHTTSVSLNNPSNDYGVIIVYSPVGNYIIQTFYSLNKINRYTRISIDGGLSFKAWIEF